MELKETIKALSRLSAPSGRESRSVSFSRLSSRRYPNPAALAALICLVFLGELKGVREGSVIAALAVGVIIRLFNRAYKKLRG